MQKRNHESALTQTESAGISASFSKMAFAGFVQAKGLVDHAISLNALATMKPDGTAVLILGGVSPLMDTQEKRTRAYLGESNHCFRCDRVFAVIGRRWARALPRLSCELPVKSSLQDPLISVLVATGWRQ
jgi:hypothetical protein